MARGTMNPFAFFPARLGLEAKRGTADANGRTDTISDEGVLELSLESRHPGADVGRLNGGENTSESV